MQGSIVLFALLLCACSGSKPAAETSPPPLREAIANEDEIVAAIRTGLREYARTITVTFDYGAEALRELPALAGEWVEAALEETGDPTEGDYIRYQYGGYEVSCRYEATNGGYAYTVELTPDYYLYRYQAELVTERLAGVYEELALDEAASDYEKIRSIYDYVCQTVRYDKVHLKNPYYHQKSTAYAALIQQSATCQGYCVLLYRMLRENGIDCRVVTGTGTDDGGDELHAWNLVRLDGAYYALDATWDAGAEGYRWFLKGSADFENHSPGEAFASESFRLRYPMAETDYE